MSRLKLMEPLEPLELVRVVWPSGARVYLRAAKLGARAWRVRFETGACALVRASRVGRLRGSGVRVLRVSGFESEGGL